MLRYTATGRDLPLRGRSALRTASGHVSNSHPLGATALRLDRRARLPLGCDGVDRVASGLPAAARSRLVHDRPLADLSTTCLLHLVVQV